MRHHVLAATAAALAVTAYGSAAQAQLTDRSGTITFTLNVARYVEVVDDQPSYHHFTRNPDGVRPGASAIGTTSILQSNPPIREVRANTPYRVSIVGLREDGQLVFTNQHGDALALTARCDLLQTSDPATRNVSTIFECRGSPVFPAADSRWVLFHAYTPTREDLNDARAGLYQATIYIQIDAA